MSLFSIFDYVGIPLGFIMWAVYQLIDNYFITIFLFTLLIRAVTFPFSLITQKSTAERARLAPRLERLQKKYAKDPKKLQAKQMKLYEKEGVSMTAGCLPSVVQMVILFGVIAVIYAPLTNLARVPKSVINASITAVAQEQKTVEGSDKKEDVSDPAKLSTNDRKGYYKELRLLSIMDLSDNEQRITDSINQLSASERKDKTAEEYYQKMLDIRKDFRFFDKTLLTDPWDTSKGFGGITILWLIPLISGLTAFGSSLLSMKFMNLATPGQKQPGQGCTNNMMIWMMPLVSLYFTFRVPGGVGIYWICSNLIAIVQTIILNKMYNPVKIRAQAEIEYQERRKAKEADKKRLAEARARDESEARRLAKEEKKNEAEKRQAGNSPKKPAASKNPNKLKRKNMEESEQQESDGNGNLPDTAAEDSENISEEKQE